MDEPEIEIEINDEYIAIAMILNFMDKLDRQGVINVYQELFKMYCYKCGAMIEEGVVCECE